MSNLTRWDPFAELSVLQKQFFGDDWMSFSKGINIPTTDVYIKDNELIVEVHLPNFTQDNVDIQVENGDLIIQAQRHDRQEDKDKKYVVRESSSSFYRRIQLPERASSEKIKASLGDGVLMVSVPMTPLPEAKKITIDSKSQNKITD